MKQWKQIAIAAALAAGTFGVAQAQSYLNVNFNNTQNVGGENTKFRGSFTYGGVVYGPNTAIANPSAGVTAPTANSINLSAFTANTIHNPYDVENPSLTPKLGNDKTYEYSPEEGGGTGNAVVYRFYRQEYSGVVGNLTKGVGNLQEERRQFVKAVVGQGTSYWFLPTSGNYTYNGVAFTNFPTGDFSYTVNLATKKGQGEFSLNDILVPASWVGQTGVAKRLNVEGTLNEGTILPAGFFGLGAASVQGTVTAGAKDPNNTEQVALWNAVVANSTDPVNPKYYLNFYGTNSGSDIAKEVAGTILDLPERIGGVAIIGKR